MMSGREGIPEVHVVGFRSRSAAKAASAVNTHMVAGLFRTEWHATASGLPEPVLNGAAAVVARGGTLHHALGTLGPLAGSGGDTAAVASALTASQPTAVVVAAAGDAANLDELKLMEDALVVLQALAVTSLAAPVWLVTSNGRAADSTCRLGRQSCAHSGMWGLGRAVRREAPSAALCTADVVASSSASSQLVALACSGPGLRLAAGRVHGLQTSETLEVEVALCGSVARVPRLTSAAVRRDDDAHRWSATLSTVGEAMMAKLHARQSGMDMEGCNTFFHLLERLCMQYAHNAAVAVTAENVAAAHHRKLLAWCAAQPMPSSEPVTIEAFDSDAFAAEVHLAEHCGSRLQAVLQGEINEQSVLFPGGSLELVRPVYEDGMLASTYNACLVAAVCDIVAQLPAHRLLCVLEVGAGTGGTTASVLPVLDGRCCEYTFTDVSEMFLRQARRRFSSYSFVEYALLNVDADPRLQGFASHRCDLLTAVNVVHATPTIVTSLKHCRQLLAPGGMMAINEVVQTLAIAQVTFGLTEGWWMFSDAERAGQDSPLLSWAQWNTLLLSSGFGEARCAQGDGWLQAQAVMVACTPCPTVHQRRATAATNHTAAGVHWITGGLGGLGLVAARVLRARCPADELLLASRSGRVQAGSEADWKWLVASGSLVSSVLCDVSEHEAVRGVGRRVNGSGRGLRSIFHAAGVLADATLAKQTGAQFATVYAAKVGGMQQLQAACLCWALDALVVCSSVASLLGSAGQSPHSAASSWLDRFAEVRHACGMRAHSTQWGAVADVGYAARKEVSTQLEGSMLGPADRTLTVTAMEAALFAQRTSAVMLGVFAANWRKAPQSTAPPFFEPLVMQSAAAAQGSSSVGHIPSSSMANKSSGLGAMATVSTAQILEVAANVAGHEVDLDTPLMESGIDSLGSVELRNQLQQLSELSMPATITFDHPTVRQLAVILQADSDGCDIDGDLQPVSQLGELRSIAVGALSPRLAGGAKEVGGVWSMVACGSDVLGEVPTMRWDAAVQTAAMNKETQARARFAGFMHGLDLFDQRCFGISPTEAAMMDPQQRLLLEHGYEALHGAALRRGALLGSSGGVFLGITYTEFVQIVQGQAKESSAYGLTGTGHCFAAGRISFLLGMQGPAVAYDTACSASLVACHAAGRALQLSECAPAALVVGVNAMLVPQTIHMLAVCGMTSPTGRSHTFDQSADGFARGEACGAAIATAERGTFAGCWASGTVVRQDGKSASLAAPSGIAQQGLLRAALACSGVAADELCYAEAHGTGTALGDPIEVGSFAAVMLGAFALSGPLLGGLKASIGHAEPAAGIAGLGKLKMQLQHGMAGKNAQLRALNCHLLPLLHDRLCLLPTCVARCNRATVRESYDGGVSSFGLGGTIAHCLLRCSSNGTSSSPPMQRAAHATFALSQRRRDVSWVAGGVAVPQSSATIATVIKLAGAHSTSALTDALLCLSNRPTPAAFHLRNLSCDLLAPHDHLALVLMKCSLPYITACHGAISGSALLVPLYATCSLAHADTTFEFSRVLGPHLLHAIQRRLQSSVAHHALSFHTGVDNIMLDPTHALELGLVDFVGTSDELDVEMRRLERRLATLPPKQLRTCKTELPASTVESAIVVMGGLTDDNEYERGNDAVIARLSIDEHSRVAHIILNDPDHFNTFSAALGQSVALAVARVRELPQVTAVVLSGAGKHFSVGGNPYRMQTVADVPHAALASSLKTVYDGFIRLRSLPFPCLSALHGTLVGGALAGFLHCDYAVAEILSTFEHGNLVRGVCPLGMLSKTLCVAIGREATLQVYLRDTKLSATDAAMLGLVHETQPGIKQTMHRAVELGEQMCSELQLALLDLRLPVSKCILDEEAVGHAECLIAHRGMTKKTLASAKDAALPIIEWSRLQSAATSATANESDGLSWARFVVPQTMSGSTPMVPKVDVLKRSVVVFTGEESADNFCLGGDPSGTNLQNGSFLDGLIPFAHMHKALQDSPLPLVAVCKGATRGGGMSPRRWIERKRPLCPSACCLLTE